MTGSSTARALVTPEALQGEGETQSPLLPAAPSRSVKVVGMRAIASILAVPERVATLWRAHGLPVKQGGEKRRGTDSPDKHPDTRLSARVVDLLEWRKEHPELEPPLRRLRAYRLDNPDLYPEEVRKRLRSILDEPPDVASQIAFPQVSYRDAWNNAVRSAPRVPDSLAGFAIKLASHANDDTGVIQRLSVAWFAQTWGIDERTVQIRLRRLLAFGLLRIEELYRTVPRGPRRQSGDRMDPADRPWLANRYTLLLDAAIMRGIGLRVDDRVLGILRERGLEPFEGKAEGRAERKADEAPSKKRGSPRRAEALRQAGEPRTPPRGDAGEAREDAGAASRPSGTADGRRDAGDVSRPAAEASDGNAGRGVDKGAAGLSGEAGGTTATPELDENERLLLAELAAHPAWAPLATAEHARELNSARKTARKEIEQVFAAMDNCARVRGSEPPAQRWIALTLRFLPVQNPVRAEDAVQRTLVALAPFSVVAEDFAYADHLVTAWRKAGRGDDLAPLLVLLHEAARTMPASDGQLPGQGSGAGDVAAKRAHIEVTVLGRAASAPPSRAAAVHGSMCSPKRCFCALRNPTFGVFPGANPDP